MEKKRRYGARALADCLDGVLQPVWARRGFASADLVASWEDIAGSPYGAVTRPEKIIWPRQSDPGKSAGATLVLRVEGAYALPLQHESGRLIERINTAFGYPAIARLRLLQGVVTHKKPPAQKVARPLAAQDRQRIEAMVAPVGDDALRQALSRLGEAIWRDRD